MSHWDTGPAVPAGGPYPAPGPGPVTTWRLRTPTGEPVGALRWDEGGVEWRPAEGGSADARAHAEEVAAYLRGNAVQGTPLADALAGVQEAYAEDLDES